MGELKKTPLYEEHLKLNAKMIEFGGWEMPVWYTSIIEEHNKVREKVGIFDVSHMGEIEIKGKDAQKFIEYLLPNRIEDMKPYDILYTPMCNHEGGIVDDLLAYKYDEENFLLVVNASNIEKDFNWIREQSKNYNINIKNISDEIAQIAIQGPLAEKQLQKIFTYDLNEIEFYKFRTLKYDNFEIILSRTGYTGEDGFEIYCKNEISVEIWKKLLQLVEEVGGSPSGLGARDTLRFEPKLLLYGNEMNDEITPLEAGLKWTLNLEKNFIGSEKILEQQKNGLKKVLRGIEINSKMPVRHDYGVYDAADNKIGYVTSGVKSPTLNKNLALIYIDKDKSKIGNEIFIKAKNKLLEAKIIKTPFYKGTSKGGKK
ncbi:MAG: aminomethyltransferase [Oceanotoga sp.]|uniref:glycine cleavage system aminomethyltransferase GcvT n=1 Tax=Oceanotoga sp. TaxID=2108366 RepID=UPI00264D65CF|nr:glycine cleavage system aminomethyltransferase GcvT [Oceanotoga sp.]MDN5343582.1 aminomethyltransferase [Oceanotoga sp.]